MDKKVKSPFRRILSLLLCISMVLSCSVSVNASDVTQAINELTTNVAADTQTELEETDGSTAPSKTEESTTSAETEETTVPAETEKTTEVAEAAIMSVAEEDDIDTQADTGTDYLFFATDRHANTSIIATMINNMENNIGENKLEYLGLGGDMVGSGDSHPAYNSSTVLTEVTDATSSLSATNVDIVAGIHDMNVNDDKDIVLPYSGGGAEIYEGDNYYVYGVPESCISGAVDGISPETEANDFITWANGEDIDKSKVIIVLSHYPLHQRRNDNVGAVYWANALNTVAVGNDTTIDRDIIFFWGHNHTGETSADTAVYHVDPKGTISVQGGSSNQTIYFTYANAGYLNENSSATLLSITDTDITFTKYTNSNTENQGTVTRVITETTPSLNSIAISGTTSYTVGDALNLKVTANYSDNSSVDVTNKATLTGYDMSTVGTQTVTATYEDKSATTEIIVSEGENGNENENTESDTTVNNTSGTATVPGNSTTTTKEKPVYVKVDTPVAGEQYLIVSTGTVGTSGYVMGGSSVTPVSGTLTINGTDGTYTYIESTGTLWTASGSGSSWNFANGSNYLGYSQSSSGNSYVGGLTYSYAVNTAASSTTWTLNNSQLYIYLEASKAGSIYGGSDSSANYYLTGGSSWSMSTTAANVYFYKPVTATVSTTTGTQEATYGINITVGDGDTGYTEYTQNNVVDGTTLQLGSVFTSSVTDQVPSGGSYTWSSDNTEVAAVDDSGRVTFTGKEGIVKIKVSYTWGVDGVSYTIWNTIAITTTAPPYVIDITKDGESVTGIISEKGVTATTTLQLGSSVTYEDENGDTQTVSEPKVVWESSDESVATVDSTGKVTFKGVDGTSIIKASYTTLNGKTVEDEVTISATTTTYIVPSDGTTDFPEYPNEGAIRFDKTAEAVGNFSQTGIAQVELSMTGVPYTTNKAMDVVVMLDMTGSMSSNGMEAAEEATKAFVEKIVKNEDGTYNSNRIAVYAFNSGSSSPYELVSLKSITEDSELSTANTAIDTASDKQTSGGTPFDEAAEKCYDVLRAAKTDGIGNDRQQFCVFMSDGGPTTYKGSDGYTYYGGNASGDRKITDYISGYSSSTSSSWTFNLPTEYYTDLMKADGVTVYTVGLLLQTAPENPSPYSKMTDSTYDSTTDSLTSVGSHYYFTSAILKQMASDESKYIDIFSVDNADNATAKFTAIAESILEAATNVVVEDKIAGTYTLVLESPNNTVTSALPSGQEFYIEVVSYALDENHERTDNITTIEKIYLTDTDKVTTDENGNITYIEGDTFTYDASTRILIWKADKLSTTELAIRYFVYLNNSAGYVGEDGEAEAGTYPTNDYATITYTNYLGNECQQKFPVPQLTWNGAQVSYVFYLVNSEGQPINKSGQVVDFANATFITDVFTESIVWNEEEGVTELNAIKKAEELLPSAYTLYDSTTQYQIHVYQTENGTDIYNYFVITAGGGTTKVYNTKAGTKYSDPGTYTASNVFDSFDFANTTVAFAVVWEPALVEDTVVVDYGLPVVINVVQNDLMQNTVSGIGLSDEAYGDVEMNTGVSGTSKLGTAALTTKDGSTISIENENAVRFTQNDMTFVEPTTFYYESPVEFYEGSNKQKGYMYSSVTVVPATSIYYEDTTTFVTYTDSTSDTYGKWSVEGTVNTAATQDADRPGESQISSALDADNIYGYDSTYLDCDTYSLGSAHKVTVSSTESSSWPTASFTFTGTAFDIISQTSNTTGTITVNVVSTDGSYNKNWIVDTYYGYTYKKDSENPYIKYTFTYGTDGKWHVTATEKVKSTELADGESTEVPAAPEEGDSFVTFEENGTWTTTTTTDNTLYQIPVIKSPELAYGTYTVTITPRYANAFNHTANEYYDFYMDAVRIYNPAQESSAANEVYAQDGEGYPESIEIRNVLLGQDAFDTATDSITGAVFIDGFGTSGTISDYSEYGPNNEVYLEKGQSVAFTLTNANYENFVAAHIGVKAPEGGTASVIVTALDAEDDSKNPVAGNSTTISTSSATELYYDISKCVTWDEGVSKVIIITNESDTMVSLTNIKVTHDEAPAAATALAISYDDAMEAVSYASARYLASVPVAEPEVFSPETLTVSLNKTSARVGDTIKATITTSADVALVTVNGSTVSQNTIDETTGLVTWTYSMTASEEGELIVEVLAYSSNGVASEAVINTVTVKASVWTEIKNWLTGLFGR